MFFFSASYLVPCSKADPAKLNECAKEHGINAIPFLLKGEYSPLSGLISLHNKIIPFQKWVIIDWSFIHIESLWGINF